jgi:hypothetical protein
VDGEPGRGHAHRERQPSAQLDDRLCRLRCAADPLLTDHGGEQRDRVVR